jgi:hypothetical protein
MDTDDLSIDTYKAIILEAEKFNHDLTLQFGMLSGGCKSEEDYLNESVKLINEIRDLSNEELNDLFFGKDPNKKKLIETLDQMINNIEQVKIIPKSERTFEF